MNSLLCLTLYKLLLNYLFDEFPPFKRQHQKLLKLCKEIQNVLNIIGPVGKGFKRGRVKSQFKTINGQQTVSVLTSFSIHVTEKWEKGEIAKSLFLHYKDFLIITPGFLHLNL